MQTGFSWRDMFREFSEKSIALLSTNIMHLSRSERRRRECARRGVNLAQKADRKYLLQGILGPSRNGNFTINGVDVKVDETTWVFGNLIVGSKVTAMIGESSEGLKRVRKIIVEGQ